MGGVAEVNEFLRQVRPSSAAGKYTCTFLRLGVVQLLLLSVFPQSLSVLRRLEGLRGSSSPEESSCREMPPQLP